MSIKYPYTYDIYIYRFTYLFIFIYLLIYWKKHSHHSFSSAVQIMLFQIKQLTERGKCNVQKRLGANNQSSRQAGTGVTPPCFPVPRQTGENWAWSTLRHLGKNDEEKRTLRVFWSLSFDRFKNRLGLFCVLSTSRPPGLLSRAGSSLWVEDKKLKWNGLSLSRRNGIWVSANTASSELE